MTPAAEAVGTAPTLPRRFVDLLEDLVAVDTQSPLETGRLPDLGAAMQRLAEAAGELGGQVDLLAPPPPAAFTDPAAPVQLREAYAAFGDDLRTAQPNLVLRFGERQPVERTIVWNVHIDTVGGDVPRSNDGVRLAGRGTVDAKGPAVAVLAGIEAARRHDGALDDVCVLVQAVGGEEGGAMGFHGTKVLIDDGHIGEIVVFCEPTGGLVLRASSATMTARIAVDGADATDDAPGAGHNATVILGAVATEVAATADEIGAAGGTLCVAGVRTGDSHNRVYGSGRLLVNVGYGDADGAAAVEGLVTGAYDRALSSLAARLGSSPVFGRTAREAAQVTRLEWLKRGLPTLRPRGDLHPAFADAGLREARPDELAPFTCDAIWAHALPGTAVVLGPGSLEANGAHTPEEFVLLADLGHHTAAVERLLLAFSARQRASQS